MVSKIEIYAKFLHTNSTRAQAPACSSLSRLISPRAYLWYTPWYTHEPTEPPWWTVPVHRIGRVTLRQGAVRSRLSTPSHTHRTPTEAGAAWRVARKPIRLDAGRAPVSRRRRPHLVCRAFYPSGVRPAPNSDSA